MEKLSQYKEVNDMTKKPPLQVNLCASFVIEPLEDYLNYWCKEFELPVNITLSPYNQVFQQLLNPESLLNQNNGINILFVRIEDWLRDQTDQSTSEQVNFLNKTYLNLTGAIKQSRKNNAVPCLIGIVPLSISHYSSIEVADQIAGLNEKLYSLLGTIPGLHLLDLNKIGTLYDIEEIFDAKSDEIGHIPFTQEYYAALGTFLSRKIRAYKSPSYKVIALDCDNTLWKGICGEDGPTNVIIDTNYAYVQEFLLEKYREGFLLVLCTKNNEADVWEVFDRNEGMILKRERIAAYRINWNPKSGNLASIAQELNLGVDSFIFIDDSNFEIEQMSFSCPEVLSINLPEDPSTFFSFLNHIWEFDLFNVTEEDLQRNNLYKAEKQRKEEQDNYEYLNDFLESLNIKTDLHELEEKNLDRALQLTLRTNQFNLNGIKKTRKDILKYINDHEALKWIIEVKDRFGNYGLVGLLLAKEIQNTLVIETFLLSCRVLGRNIEDFVLSELKTFCIFKELDIIKAEFRLTEKNKPFTEFLRRTNWIEDNKNNTYNYLVKKGINN